MKPVITEKKMDPKFAMENKLNLEKKTPLSFKSTKKVFSLKPKIMWYI